MYSQKQQEVIKADRLKLAARQASGWAQIEQVFHSLGMAQREVPPNGDCFFLLRVVLAIWDIRLRPTDSQVGCMDPFIG